MNFVQRQKIKGVLWVVAHPKLTLLLSAVLLVAAVGWAKLRLSVSTDQNKLFSHNVKFFRDFLEFDKKFPENEAIYVLIEPRPDVPRPPVSRWIEADERIAQRLSAMSGVKVENRIPIDDPKAPAILFDDPAKIPEDFRQAAEQLGGLARIWGEQPSGASGLLSRLAGPTPTDRFLLALQLRPPTAQSAQFVRALADSWVQTARHPNRPVREGEEVPFIPAIGAEDPSQLGYYYQPDRTDPSRHLLLVRVYMREDVSSLDAVYRSVDRIRQAVYEVAGNYPEFDVGLTGRPVLDADEMQITDRDSHHAEIIALIVVFIGLVALLRSIWLAVVAEVSLAVAIGWTFGWATVSVHELNLLSIVFLIALIGIGMDYLIQILAAYRREARRYIRQRAIWTRTFRYVGPPIITACFGAAGAFLVSIFTDFKGAADLGIIAGGGLLLCLFAGYTVLPALLVLFPARLKPYTSTQRYGSAPQRSGKRLLLPCLWIAALLAGIPFARRTTFNPNLLELQAPNLSSVVLIKKLQAWSAVVLSPDLDMLRKVRDAVRTAPAVAGTESILTAFDNHAWIEAHASELPKIQWARPTPVAPGDLPRLAARARGLANHFQPAAGPETSPAGPESKAAAASLRAFADVIDSGTVDAPQVAAALSKWQDVFVDEIRRLFSMLTPPPLEVQNIPTQLREHLASTVDQPRGQYLYALYIDPKEDLWKRENLKAFEEQVEARVASVPGAPSVTGITSDIYHTTSSIEGSFYTATTYALILILVLVFIDLRDVPQTLIAVSVLALGLPMLVALMGLLGVDWNFANYFGLPILIGAGHEYGVFMMHRYREARYDHRRVWRRWDPSDRALFLCAFVTSSSFGFFWAMGHHKGLRSLGLVMALGTACIYLATITVVRPLLTWHLEHLRTKAGGPGSGPRLRDGESPAHDPSQPARREVPQEHPHSPRQG